MSTKQKYTFIKVQTYHNVMNIFHNGMTSFVNCSKQVMYEKFRSDSLAFVYTTSKVLNLIPFREDLIFESNILFKYGGCSYNTMRHARCPSGDFVTNLVNQVVLFCNAHVG